MKTKNDTLNAIQTMVDSAIKKAGYNTTRNAVVINRNANNTYKIKMDGIEYDNVIHYGNDIHSVGEVVKVIIPNNQASQMYILGKGGKEGVTGVKGDAEDDYRKGDVNLTAENIGAAKKDMSNVGERVIQGNQLDIADYVLEQGTLNGWFYRKWSSNVVELWKTLTVDLALTTSGAGGYTTSSTPLENLPFVVNNATGQVTVGGTSAFVISTTSDTTISYKPYRMNSHALDTYTFNFYVMGTYTD